MEANSFAVGPFSGNARKTSIRVWGATEKSDIADEFTGVVRWKVATEIDFSDSNHSNFRLSKHFDGVGICDIGGLEPDTRYEFQLCYVPSGTNWQDIEWPISESTLCHSNTTPLDSSSPSTCFILGSCRDHGSAEDGLSDEAFKTINQMIRDSKISIPDMLWMTGDQIYIDRTTGLNSKGYEKFRDLYRKQFTETEFSKLMKVVPAYLQMDDHEVDNDWSYSGMQNSTDTKKILDGGMRSFNAYQASLGPIFNDEDDFISFTNQKPYKQNYWYTIERHDCDFFVMDVRFDREQSGDTWKLRSTGEEKSQIDDLLSWISSAQANKVHFIVTPVPMFPDPKKFKFSILWLIGSLKATRKEIWTGNTIQRNQILNAIDASDAKFVFLSGDVHCSFIASIVTNSGKKIHNVVSSAFNWMLPGLNGNHFKWNKIEQYDNQANDIILHNGHVEHRNNFTHIQIKEDCDLVVTQFNAHNGERVSESIKL